MPSKSQQRRAAGIQPNDKTDPSQTRADGQGAAVPRVPTTEAPHTTTVDAPALEAAIRARGEDGKGGGEDPTKVAESKAKAAKRELTDVHSHKAVKRGYANGIVVEPGDFVPAGVPVSDFNGDDYEGWMLEADDPQVAEAIAENAE